MLRKFLAFSLAVGLVAVLSSAATAQNKGSGTTPNVTPPPEAVAGLVSASDFQTIAEIAMSHGSAEITTDALGEPSIEGEIGGVRYQIFFYGCVNGANCTDIQFDAAWNASPPEFLERDTERVASWNRERRFAKSYLETDGTIVVQLDVNLEGGVPRNNFEDTFRLWVLTLQDFPSHMFE